MEPPPESPSEQAVLRREVERPGAGGHGLLPVLVLAAAMTLTLAAAALAMTITPRAHHCPRSGRTVAPVVAPAPSFARPATPAPSFARPARPAPRAPLVRGASASASASAAPVLAPAPVVPVAGDLACAPRVDRGDGDVQQWTYETCASAPMPRRFVLSQP